MAAALPISPLLLELPFTQCQLEAGEASLSAEPPVHWSSTPLALKGSCLNPFLVLAALFKMPGHSDGLPSMTGTCEKTSLHKKRSMVTVPVSFKPNCQPGKGKRSSTFLNV